MHSKYVIYFANLATRDALHKAGIDGSYCQAHAIAPFPQKENSSSMPTRYDEQKNETQADWTSLAQETEL